jgi:fumarylacetoacetase
VTGFGVFAPRGEEPRVGFRAGDSVLDLSGLGDEFRSPSLNAFMARGPIAWQRTYEQVRSGAVDSDAVPLADVEVRLPFEVGDYVDFYSSLEHAGTVVPSGTPVRRPRGQSKPPDADAPVFGASARLDIELELGFVVGVGSRLGEPVHAERFAEHVFGVVLVNDWSARDLQAWEYHPLGPFLGKSFTTSISVWVTPLAALEAARVARPPQEPEPLPYLRVADDWTLDLELEVELNGSTVSRTNARSLYWSMPQQLAHATVNGASIRTGDLMATGTISGSERGSEGSLIELTRNGAEPLRLEDGSERTFLEDGDEVVLRGRAGDVELGEVCGRIDPAT